MKRWSWLIPISCLLVGCDLMPEHSSYSAWISWSYPGPQICNSVVDQYTGKEVPNKKECRDSRIWIMRGFNTASEAQNFFMNAPKGTANFNWESEPSWHDWINTLSDSMFICQDGKHYCHVWPGQVIYVGIG
jgi:hypothetical protein